MSAPWARRRPASSLTASGRSQSIEGTVRITATEVTAAYVLPPIVARLRLAEPGIVVEVVASNSLSDLRRREADIAVRSARPDGPGSGRAQADG